MQIAVNKNGCYLLVSSPFSIAGYFRDPRASQKNTPCVTIIEFSLRKKLNAHKSTHLRNNGS